MLNATWLYVAAVYALAVWLARRGGTELPWRIAAFFYGLVLVYLFAPLTRDVVNLPADFLGSMPPYIFKMPYPRHTVLNGVLNDLVLQIVPWAHEVRESWKHLTPPLWNNFAGSGYPLLANAQSSAFSPLRILAIPLPLGSSFAAEAAWKLLIALTFTYLICRRRGYGELPSALGAAAFGFCSFLIVWLHFPLVTAACMLPAIVFGVELLAERVTYRRVLFAAISWTVMLFAGHPETASHAFFLALMLVLWIVAVERPFPTRRELLRFVGALCAAMTIAALLAAPYLAPLAEAITKSKRYHELQALPNAIGYYSDWMSTIAWLQPSFYGGTGGDGSWPWGPATAESITGFAGILGVAAWFTLAAYVIATRRWRSREAFLVVATAIVLGLVLAVPGLSELFHLVFKLAANARLRLLLCFLAALQSAAALDLLMRGHRKVFLSGLVAAAVILLLMITTITFPFPMQLHGAVAAMTPSIIVLIVASIAAVLRRGQRAALLVLAALVIGEVWTPTRDWNPTVPARTLYPQTPLLTALAAEREKHPPTDPFRIVGLGPVLFPNISTIYGFEDVRAHDPMANGRYLGLLRVLAKYDTNEYFAKWSDADTPILDFLNVRYVVGPPKADLGGRYAKIYDGRDGTIFENTAVLPRFYPARNVILEFNNDKFAARLKSQDEWASTSILKSLDVDSDRERTDLLAPRPANAPLATLRMQKARPTKFEMTVDAPRHTLIVSSIPWWPGWKATIAGEEIRTTRINGGFLGFVVPPGMTDVVVSYDPITFRGGMWLMGMTVLGLVAWPRLRARFAA